MAIWRQGWNFRNTIPFVTDGNGQTPCIASGNTAATPDYLPTCRRNGVFGYLVDPGDTGRDRDATLDPRLAGIHYNANTSAPKQVRLALNGPGTYDFYIAVGDAASGQSAQFVRCNDHQYTLLNINQPAGSAFASFFDATNTQYAAANWPSQNRPKRVRFRGPYLDIFYGDPAQLAGASTTLAYFAAVQITSEEDEFDALLFGGAAFASTFVDDDAPWMPGRPFIDDSIVTVW